MILFTFIMMKTMVEDFSNVRILTNKTIKSFFNR